MFEVSAEISFAAAHALRGYRGKCENIHGHNYKVEVTVEGEQLDETGLLVDFGQLKAWLRAVAERLDHRLLNQVDPFDVINPTAENLARYFYQQIDGALRQHAPGHGLRVSRVKVWEAEDAAATYRGP